MLRIVINEIEYGISLNTILTKSSRKSIVFIVDEFFPISSAPAVRVNSFLRVITDRWDCRVVCGSDVGCADQDNHPIKDVYYERVNRPSEKSPIRFLCFLLYLMGKSIQHILTKRPDAVVLSIPKYELLATVPLLSRLCRHFVLDVRDSYSFIDYEAYFRHFLTSHLSRMFGRAYKTLLITLLRVAIKSSHLVTAANEGIRDDLVDLLPEATGKVNIIPNGVDTHLFDGQREIADEEARVIYVGNFAEKDRFEWLIDVVGAMENQGKNVDVVMLGDGRNRYQVERNIQKRGLTQRFRLIGRVPHHQIPSYIGKAHAGIILRDDEVTASIPVCLYEFMAMGLPVVVNDVGHMAAFVRDSNAGFVVQDRDELRTVLENLNRDFRKIHSKFLHTREWVIRNASRQGSARLFLSMIEEFGEGS